MGFSNSASVGSFLASIGAIKERKHKKKTECRYFIDGKSHELKMSQAALWAVRLLRREVREAERNGVLMPTSIFTYRDGVGEYRFTVISS